MTPRRRRQICRENGCAKEPDLGGLCRRHHDEAARKEERRYSAFTCLNSQAIDGQVPTDPGLRDELGRLCRWWDRACFAVRTEHDSESLPLDEARYAMEWCIALAAEIVQAELAIRAGGNPAPSLQATRSWVWDRFENLETGLMSNGIPRPKPGYDPSRSADGLAPRGKRGDRATRR